MDCKKMNSIYTIVKLSENTFSICKDNILYNLSIIWNEKTINLTFLRQLASNFYEGIFTYSDFTKISNCFLLYETLEEIYEALLIKFSNQEIYLTDEYNNLFLKFEFIFDERKKYEVVMKIPKNPEMDINIVVENMSKMILQLSDTVSKLVNQVDKLNEKGIQKEKEAKEKKSVSRTSTIIKNQAEIVMIIEWLNFDAKFELLYKSNYHGKGGKDFHIKCDNKGPTISIIETTDGFRLGGYTTLDWDSSGQGKSNDRYAFLFSIDKKKKLTCNDQDNVIFCLPNYGPTFGLDGNDLYVRGYFTGSHSSLNSYGQLEGVGQFYLTGVQQITVKELEVYSVKK